MNVLGLLSGIAPKLFGVIDEVVMDKDQALKIKSEISSQMLDRESDLVKHASSVINNEAKGESWLQRNWRPMTMLFFLFLLGAYWFGFVPVAMPAEHITIVFELLKIGIGGYVVGRSGEKIAKAAAPYLTKRP